MLSSCALSLALVCQQPAATEMPPDVAKPFTQLETMRRMLTRKIEEKRVAIVGDEAADERAPENVAGLGGGNVTRDLMNSFGGQTVVSSRADYIPGLAAIFDLTVNVRAELVEEEEKPATEKPRASKNADDEVWEEVARSDSEWRTLQSVLNDRNADKGPRKHFRFAPGSVDALKSTVMDTIWRFGNRLELERGERLAVVVEMRGGGRYARNVYGTWPADPAAPANKGSAAPATDHAAASELLQLRTLGYAVEGAGAPTAAHVVFQVSAEDLKAWRNGEIDRDDMAKRTRVQSFVAPTGGATSYTWFNGARAPR
jgi:hypothetical protein